MKMKLMIMLKREEKIGLIILIAEARTEKMGLGKGRLIIKALIIMVEASLARDHVN